MSSKQAEKNPRYLNSGIRDLGQAWVGGVGVGGILEGVDEMSPRGQTCPARGEHTN